MTLSRKAMMAAVAAGALALPGAAQAATRTMNVGPPGKNFNKRLGKLTADVNDFFPHTVTIHVGDSIRFVNPMFHTWDLAPKGSRELPIIALDPSKPVSENDPSGAPFWFNGLGTPGFNPVLFGPVGPNRYNGRVRIDSGLPLGPASAKPRKIKFTRAGTYIVYCDVHPGMKGVIRVLPKRRRIPTARRYAKALARQVARDLKEATRLQKPKLPANTIQAGAASVHGTEVMAMFPRNLTVPVGTVVTARMAPHTFDDHTFTFGDVTNPKGYVMTLANTFLGPAPDPASVYPSDNPANGPIVVSQSSHGNGFANSGVLQGKAGSQPGSVQFKFTQAGVYHYICVIHPTMRGTITVTG